jgi:curved DNA-binding protein CbpA
MSQLPDHYSTLHVQPSASTAQIKRMYHLLAKRYHPDRVPPERQTWAREQMARINAAYETLSDPQRRAEHDLLRGYRESANVGPAVWRGQRLRERSRRLQAERWRAVSVASLTALAIGLLGTALFVRTSMGYLLAAVLNGTMLGLLLLSLVMVNQ